MLNSRTISLQMSALIFLRSVRRLFAYTWASPCTAVGLLIGAVAVFLGAKVKWVRGTLEFSGGLLGWAATCVPGHCKFSAVTMGHTILGVCPQTLSVLREHERVHVRQYERWGILFVPAYLLSSLWQGLRGRRMYLDNCFEREAYSTALPTHIHPAALATKMANHD